MAGLQDLLKIAGSNRSMNPAFLQSFNPAMSPSASGCHRPASWLHHREALATERTRARLVCGDVDFEQRGKRDVELRPPVAAAIDDGGGADDLAAGGLRDLNRLARRSARGPHVLDHEHAIGFTDDESTPQRERAVLTFREQRTGAEGARHFMADDDAAECGRKDHRGTEIAHPLADRAPERLGVLRVL